MAENAENAKKKRKLGPSKLAPAKKNLLFKVEMLTLPPYWLENSRNEEMNKFEFVYVNKNITKRITTVLLQFGYNSTATLMVEPDENTFTVPPEMRILKINQQNVLQASKFPNYVITYLIE